MRHPGELRPLGMPRPIRVEVGEDRLPAAVYGERRVRVLQVRDQWRLHDEWWRNPVARCYYQVLMHHGVDHWGRYIDEYEQRDGRWLFTRRQVTLDGYVPGGMGEAGAADANG